MAGEAEKLEIEVEGEDLKVEIVDDTPPQDRGRQPLPKEVLDELEKDDLEEYSAKVKSRINTARKAYHDERRAKETATREREEAIRLAQTALEENKALKKRLSVGEQIFASETTKAAATELQAAKAALKQAYESGDSDRITEAQELLTDAKLKQREVASFRPTLQDPDSGVQNQPVQSQPTPVADPKAEKWRESNGWFGTNRIMTATALGLHEDLLAQGVDPRSDDYYRRVDETMRKRFSDYFEESQTPETEPEKPVRKSSTVVAPATRSTAPRQIRITASEAAIAKRLGLTNDAYARAKMKLENTNG